MKTIVRNSIGWVFLLMGWMGSLFVSCTDEEMASLPAQVEEGIPTEVKLSFVADVPRVQSRAAIAVEAENQVSNLYVFVFDDNGNHVRTFPFGSKDLNWDKAVHPGGGTKDNPKGYVTMKLFSGCFRIYALANVETESPDRKVDLTGIQTVKDLKSKVVKMTRNSVYRSSGKLMMSGFYEGEPGSQEGCCVIKPGVNSLKSIKLTRLDAKVTFTIGLGSTKDSLRKNRRFTPKQWKVVNVPLCSNLFPQDKIPSAEPGHFFSMDRMVNFETTNEQGQSSFTFYQMENYYKEINGIIKYEDREKEKKNPDGTNLSRTDPASFVYAPATSTYVVLTGDYYEQYAESDDSDLFKERYAEVVYTIHLGYLPSKDKPLGDPKNFECRRNTNYTYRVFVEGVDKIRLEVTSYDGGKGETKEEQPGAEGSVVESDKFFEFDAHYDRTLLVLKKSDLEGRSGFKVSTPFDQGYYYVNQNEEDKLPGALPYEQAKDYRWIWFRRNETYPSGNYRKNRLQNYQRDKVMDVAGLLQELHGDRPIFDHNEEVVYTVFIDEFYYPTHPEKGKETPSDFWKQFVNRPNRTMHILCNTQYSQDKESSLTTSSIMVSQRSIKTFYNEKAGPSLQTAWGIETVNETGELEPPQDNPWNKGKPVNQDGRFKFSTQNGRYNLFRQLELDSYNWRSWSTYVHNQYSDTSRDYLVDDASGSHKLVYACLQRNRDEDGDGKIHPKEVKWYPAAIHQYTDIWMGKDALPTETHLYRNGDARYRRYLSSDGQELYAEEGSSIGGWKFQWANSIDGAANPTTYDYRCVRNLGMDGAEAGKMPQSYVQVSKTVKNRIELIYMNEQSIRSDQLFQNDEFALHDELSPENRPYRAFEYQDAPDTEAYNWQEVQTKVNGNNSPCRALNKNGQTGWRLPNQREMVLMSALAEWGDNRPHHPTRTKAADFMTGKKGWGHTGGKNAMTIPQGSGLKAPVRCVRDVKLNP